MKTVPIVEDNLLNMRLASAILGSAGYEVLEATNAEDGLALAREHRPAVVLMDLHLPGDDGVAALQALRADPGMRHAKVFVFTASAGDRDAERMLAAKFDGCVPKPFDIQELLDAVAAVFSGQE